MGRLQAKFTPAFSRDLKRKAGKRGWDLASLEEVMALIMENSPNSLQELHRRHRMHPLGGKWGGSFECHVANAGDWLLVWAVDGEVAYFQRTGSHDEIFR